MTEHSEFSHSPQDLTQTFIQSMESVAAYNNRHTGPGYLGNFMAGILGSMIEGYEPPEVSQAEEAEMERGLIDFLHADELASMGVYLFDPSKIGEGRVSKGELETSEHAPVSLTPLISDGDKFADTLGRINPTMEEADQVTNNVDLLLGNSVRLIQAGYSEDVDSDERTQRAVRHIVDKQLEMFMDLVPKLAQKGYTELPSYQKLVDYTARRANGTFEDYIGAEMRGLLTGPTWWHRDSSPEVLDRNWGGAFGYLKQLRDKPEQSAYYHELFEKLHSDFKTAQKWTQETIKDGDTLYTPIYLQNLQAKMAELATVWEKEFPVEVMLAEPPQSAE